MYIILIVNGADEIFIPITIVLWPYGHYNLTFLTAHPHQLPSKVDTGLCQLVKAQQDRLVQIGDVYW